jgi:hypothetical protein
MNAAFPLFPARLRPLFFACSFLSVVAAGRATAPEVSSPPHHPDATHVFNGCHLSALAYLDRFATEFPAERGRRIVVEMRNRGGRVRSHAMALVTWKGAWWVRDEYFGVFALDCGPAHETSEVRLVARAEQLYARHVATAVRAGAALPPEPPAQLSPEDHRRNVIAAAAKLARAHTIYWIKDGAREVPLMFFRPSPTEVGIYDPVHGSAVVECASRDDATITALIAGRLGYRVDSIRAETATLNSPLVAANTAAP